MASAKQPRCLRETAIFARLCAWNHDDFRHFFDRFQRPRDRFDPPIQAALLDEHWSKDHFKRLMSINA